MPRMTITRQLYTDYLLPDHQDVSKPQMAKRVKKTILANYTTSNLELKSGKVTITVLAIWG